ncbi:MAG: hypothetical protein J6S67_11595 [Methanobrevibacter sp.]|nr:hypothetical protein [Methanobrevibacter sp.]
MKKVSSVNFSIHYHLSSWQGEKLILLCNKKKNKVIGFRYAEMGDFTIKGKYLLFTTPQNFDAVHIFMNDSSERWLWLLSNDRIEVV